MATEKFDEFIKRKQKYPLSFGEYDGEEDDDEEVEISPNKDSLFEKYKKESEDEADK